MKKLSCHLLYLVCLLCVAGYGTVSMAKTTSTAPSQTAASTTAVNINTADVALLTTLPGIGESRAEAILAYRNEHGGFKDIIELANVRGISKQYVEKYRAQLTI